MKPRNFDTHTQLYTIMVIINLYSLWSTSKVLSLLKTYIFQKNWLHFPIRATHQKIKRDILFNEKRRRMNLKNIEFSMKLIISLHMADESLSTISNNSIYFKIFDLNYWILWYFRKASMKNKFFSNKSKQILKGYWILYFEPKSSWNCWMVP